MHPSLFLFLFWKKGQNSFHANDDDNNSQRTREEAPRERRRWGGGEKNKCDDSLHDNDSSNNAAAVTKGPESLIKEQSQSTLGSPPSFPALSQHPDLLIIKAREK